MKEPLHIGNIIREKLEEEGRAASWLAKKINCDRTNIYKIFNRQDINTEQLLKISEALHYDFFAHYSEFIREKADSVQEGDILSI
ncbi:MAG: helix-turn-helix domain-containing protein [Bacteroidales bacterium]|jgi:plasmid maintenance system antidote protein VapI|nr:helix-turn-helix domain-containing protein [Bacteroidales bacterium]